MAPAYRSVSGGSADASTTCTITKPSGVVDGDLLIAVISIFGSSVTVSAVPSGWTLLSPSPLLTATNANRSYVYWKVAASEGASWAWTLASGYFAWMGIAVSDPGGATPIADSQGAVDTGGDSTASAPSVTTNATSNLLMFIHCRCGLSTAMTAPSGYTNRWSARNATVDPLIIVSTKEPAGAVGATGAISGTQSSDTRASSGYHIAVGAASSSFVPQMILI